MFIDRNVISYRYAADGRKLRATYKTFPGQHVGDDDRYTERNDSGLVRPGNGRIFVPSTVVETKTVDYVGNLIYEDNVIKKILIDGGYITFNEGNAPEYHFYIKDHLGNNRVVVYTSGEVEQVNHYYPYGGLMAESTNWNTQWYKYNGKARASESRESMYALLCRVQPRLDEVKEFDSMHGLNTYDYGARQYNPVTARWDRMDPLAHKYYSVSPYVYCANNPIFFIDPDGKKRKPTGDSYKGQLVRISHNYAQQRSTHKHKGVDINFGTGAFDRGAPVLATHYGRVRLKSYKDGNAARNRAWIDYICSDGTIVSTGYFHLASFSVKNGQIVNEGDKIGEIGNSCKGQEQYDTEKNHATHLHYEVKVNNQNINPSEDPPNGLLLDPQEMIKDYNKLPDVVIMPCPNQSEQIPAMDNNTNQ